MSSVDNIPNGWEETTLGEVINIIGGGTPKTKIPEYWDGEIPWLSVVDFNNDNRWVSTTEKSITELGLNKSSTKLLNVGDIIISARGTVGAMAQLKKEMAFNQSCYGIREVKDVSDKDFLFYLIKHSLKKINRNTYGAVFDTITTKTFDVININLPPLPEQKAIANILTAFDDKIENLQVQNKTLEQTAQTIFKEWFDKYQVGDELPEGWRIGAIGDLVEIRRGGSPRPIKDYISDSGYHWLKISDATATVSPYIFEIKEFIRKEGLKKTTLKKKGDLVLSNSATPGLPKILEIDTCVHDGWMHFPESKVSNEFLYLLFLEIRPRLVQQGSGSVFVNLKTDILREYPLVIPKKSVFENFDEIIKPIFHKIKNNAQQIQTLKKTRDTLLPKLMSGQLRVKMSEHD
ncbi:restriction endonuclease subunit S [uncultured Algibacter sp.]|uniref:restriction endonuclease subunit S n=1 Tax=uncultured Algibacter sp. TaxID=298659 RepID=UPI00261E2FF6|nr:restriction endonuclease subunit S [uncultured Algibacter sp.]